MPTEHAYPRLPALEKATAQMQEVLREAMLTQGLLPVSCTPKGLQCADMLFFLRKLNASEGLQRDAVLAFFTGQSSADLKTPSGMRSLIIGDED